MFGGKLSTKELDKLYQDLLIEGETSAQCNENILRAIEEVIDNRRKIADVGCSSIDELIADMEDMEQNLGIMGYYR